jgi:hypothetical protein
LQLARHWILQGHAKQAGRRRCAEFVAPCGALTTRRIASCSAALRPDEVTQLPGRLISQEKRTNCTTSIFNGAPDLHVKQIQINDLAAADAKRPPNVYLEHLGTAVCERQSKREHVVIY